MEIRENRFSLASVVCLGILSLSVSACSRKTPYTDRVPLENSPSSELAPSLAPVLSPPVDSHAVGPSQASQTPQTVPQAGAFKGVVFLLPGSLNSAVPGHIGEDPVEGGRDLLPYFSRDIINAFRARGLLPIVIEDLKWFGKYEVNGEAALQVIRKWYLDRFPLKDAPIYLVGHSCGGFYALHVAGHADDLPIKSIVMLSTPLHGSAVAEKAFTAPIIGETLAKIAGSTGGWFDLRGLLQATVQNVQTFLADTRVKEGLPVYSIGGSQAISYRPWNWFKSEYMNSLLVPTGTLIGEENDGMVSVRSARGEGVTFTNQKNLREPVQTLSSLLMPLDHMEQMLDHRLFMAQGILGRDKILNGQAHTYGAVADLLLKHP